MTEVVLGEGDRVEWAIKVFRRKVQKAGILRDVKKKRYHLKPSDAKRLKTAAANRRRRRARRRS